MKVLIASKFLHHVGGVETYVRWLATHLPELGHQVAFFGMRPPPGRSALPELDGPVYMAPYRTYEGSPASVARSAAASVYSPAARRAFRRAVKEWQPDVIHFQSTCYQLTSSVVLESVRSEVPTLTTAHEYKFVCQNQRLWDDRRNEPCNACVGAATRERVSEILTRRCVKGGLGSSFLAAAELFPSEAIWRRSQGMIHAPSKFMASMLESAQSPVRGRVVHGDLSWGEPVFPEVSDTPDHPVVAYTGRLAPEKGVDVLIDAWAVVAEQHPTAHLRLYGSGASEQALRSRAMNIPRVSFEGRYDGSDLSRILSGTVATVHPSVWAENSPYTVRESLQHGVPAIVSSAGGLPEMISEETGECVPVGDSRALASAILREIRLNRVRSLPLRAAVKNRAVTDADHLGFLDSIYAKAK